MSSAVLLVLLALGGTAFLAGAAYLFGFNKTAYLADHEAVESCVRDFDARVEIKSTVIATNKQAALAMSHTRQLFLITMLGDSRIVRVIAAQNITALSEDHLRIDVKDFAFPALDFHAAKGSLAPMLQRVKEDMPR